MKDLAKWVAIGALFILPFVPLYVANELFFPFITGKGFAFRILVEIAAIAWVVLMLLDKSYRPKQSWLLWLFGGLTVWMFVADLLAVNPHKAFWSNYERMDGWVTLAHTFLLFLVAGALFTEKLWRKWWLTFLAGSSLVCAYGLLQIAGVLETHQGNRIDASFGNAAYLPAYLLFGIAVAFWQGMLSKGWLRYALFTLALLEVFILLFTATRGALFGLVGAVVVVAIAYGLSKGKEGIRTTVGVVAGVALVAGAFYLVKDTSMVTQSPTLSRLSSVFELSKELSVRTQIWESALTGALAAPLTGYGHEGFNYVFNANYKPSLFAQEQWFDRAHNIYLDWLVAGGVPALLLFLALMSYALIALLRKEFSLVERLTILGALVAYGIQGVVVFDNLFTYVPLAMLLAYIHARIGTPVPALVALKEAREGAASALALVVVLVGVLLMWQINVPGIQSAHLIIRSFMVANDPQSAMKELEQAVAVGGFGSQEVREQMVARLLDTMKRPDVSSEVKQQVAYTALTHMQDEVAQIPEDARLRLQFATGLRSVGDFETALQEVEMALILSPNKQTTLLEKGITLLQSGKSEEARDVFYEAHMLDTTFAVPAAYAAAGDIFVGEGEKGNALLAQYFAPTLPEVPEIVFLAYQTVGDMASVERVLRARIDAAPSSIDTYLTLASFFAQTGAKDKAKAVIAEVVAIFPQTKSLEAQWHAELDAIQ